MKNFTVQLEDEEVKALELMNIDPQKWLHNALHNRARQAIDKAVTDYSDKQASKITEAEKYEIVRNAPEPSPAPEPLEL